MTNSTKPPPNAPPERNQHFVSAFYLHRFLATDLPPRTNQGLWCVDIENGTIDVAHPRDVASAEYLYEQEDPSSPLPRIEPLLNVVETRTAPVLAAIEEDVPPSDEVDLRQLSLYLALQVARTPTGRRYMKAHLDAQRAAAIVLPADAQTFPRPKDKVMAAFWDIARHLENTPDTPDAPLLHSLVSAVRDLEPKIARAYERRGWLPLQAPPGYSYATCDHPAAIFVHPGTSLEQAARGEGSTHIVFPQSPRNLLVICLDPRSCTAVDFHEGPHVDDVNDLMLYTADKHVFCASRPLAERMLQRIPEMRASRKG